MTHPRIVHITAAAAAARGLPPVNVACSLDGLPLSAVIFPWPGCYLALSGPPGGPLGLTIEAGHAGQTPQTVVASFGAALAPVVGTAEAVVTVGKLVCPAAVCVTGHSHARSVRVVAVIGWPGTAGTVVVQLFAGGDEPDAARVLEHPVLATVLRRLTLAREQDQAATGPPS
jgi:hypothetical protein